MNMIIRPAVLADVDVICEFNRLMAQETEGKTLDPATLQPGVAAIFGDSQKGCYFVAEIEGQLVGQVAITLEWSDWRNGWFWWLQSVYVVPSARRQGIYRKLYDHVVQQARTGGVIGIKLYVDRDNSAAEAVYQKLGMMMSRYRLMEVEI
jgi:GNAT superfamily N-acetyltransferase